MKPIALPLLLASLATSPAIPVAASGRSLEVAAPDGVPIRFLTRGAGRPSIVLVSGFAGTKEEWEPQIAALSKDHRVVALDLAGFGESGHGRRDWTMEAFGADVAAVVEALDLRDVVLVGHSMGSAAVVEAARRLPDRVIAVVPVDVFQNVGERRTPEEIAARIGRAMAFAENPSREALRAALKDPVDDATLDRMVEEYRSADRTGWRESLEGFFAWSNDTLPAALAALRVPVRCINSDRMPTDVAAARRHSADFDVRIVPGVGHAVMMGDPDAFEAQLRSVLDELAARPGPG